MKFSNYIGTFALVAMLTACSTEEEQVHFAGNEVKVNAAIGRKALLPEVILLETKKNRAILMIMTK